MSRLRVVFMGSPDFSIPTLQAVLEAGHEVVCVYAQPPRPAGRGQKERRCPVHEFTVSHGQTMRTPDTLKDVAEKAAFIALNADLAVVVAYGLILPEEILSAPRLGCINVHASLLPRWRGAAPIQRAIQAGDTETGVCIMQMDTGLDTGAVYLRHLIAIDPETTGGVLHGVLSEIGGAACVEVIDGLSRGALVAEVQSEEDVTYASKLKSGEARIDWSRPAEEIARTVKAFDPWPGTWFDHEGERIKVLSASAELSAGAQGGVSGKILDERPAVACGKGRLVLHRLQRAGRKAQDAEKFLRGFNLPSGAVLK
jgi:methionyl-tRNA formyltransferase